MLGFFLRGFLQVFFGGFQWFLGVFRGFERCLGFRVIFNGFGGLRGFRVFF